jgi:PAS domain S-box-containing protein
MIPEANAAQLGHALGGLVSWLAVVAAVGLADLKAAEAAPSPLPPTSYAVNSYDINDGLPHNTTFPVLQTRDGYLWIATNAGLARFDGVRFVTYRVADTPALADNLIRSLYEDDTGVLWVGTQRGLCRYREGVFEPVTLPDNPTVVSVVKDRSGRVWIGTLLQGLWEYRDGHATVFKDPLISEDIRLRDVRSLFMDSTGRVWMWIRNKGVAYFDATGLKLFDGFGVSSDQGVPMAETSPGTLWFGTNKGVFRLRDGQLRAYGKEQGLGNATIRQMLADRQGRLWVAEGKVYVLENAEADSFVTVPLPAEYARWITQDREGSYWVGTSTEGLWQFRPSAFRMLLPDNPLLDGNVRAVAVDRGGAVWAGLPTTGVARITPDGKLSVIETGPGAAGVVGTLWPAADGSVWIGTRGSLYVWREDGLREFSQYKDIRAIYQDRAGAIWFGAMQGGGVVRYKDGEFSSCAAVIGPPKNSTASPVPPEFAEDSEGALYLGLLFRGRGVIKLKDGVMTEIGPSEIFDACEIRAIYPDREGNLWVGTIGRGLVVYSQGRWLNPDSLSVPFNDFINTIAEDDHGRMWFGTSRGILWAPKAELLAVARGEQRTAVFRQAVASDGLRPAQVGAGLFGSFPSVWKTPDGTIWFATKRGVVAVDTNQVADNPVAPPVKIERVLVGDRPVDKLDAIRLPAGTRALTIDYTALSFVRPGQVRFRYRLEGHDSNWTEAGTRRTAFYTNLAPGLHRFQVIAGNSDGVWNKTGASLTVVQEPYFYQTMWFWGAVAIVLLVIALGIYRLRTAALRRRNEQLERRIAERTAELAKSNEAIQASEYFYHSLVESLPQIIVRKDAEGRFTYANAAYGELVGRSGEQIVGLFDRDVYPPEQAAKVRADDERVMQTGQVLEYENVVERPGQKKRYLQVKKVPLFAERQSIGVLVLFWDMTVFRETEELLRHAQQELIETSRLAGIAEVATGVLHNLGNALNSVNTSASLAADRLRKSKVPGVGKVAQLLLEQGDRLVEFFATDPRGRQLPGYLEQLAALLQAERAESVRELEALQDNVDHIKQIVAAQQSYAHVSGIVEVVPPAELVEFALRISEASLTRHGVTVVREFSPAPAVKVERHKVLQILINLIRNAKEAINERHRSDKQLVLGLRTSPEGRVQIYVTDNGVGIAPENLTVIFNFGFTTKVNGHGFGLHTSANAAKEMGGSLEARSEGPGKGATFVLELPPAT